MSLLDLPNELLLEVASHIRSPKDLNHLCHLNRRTYTLLNGRLYKLAVEIDNTIPFNVVPDGLLRTLHFFCNAGADISKRYPTPHSSEIHHYLFSKTPLLHAVWKLNMPMVLELIRLGVDVNHVSQDGYTALGLVALISDPSVPPGAGIELRIAEMLLHAGADIDCPKDIPKKRPLSNATEMGNVFMVELLLQRGADVLGIFPNGKPDWRRCTYCPCTSRPAIQRLLADEVEKHDKRLAKEVRRGAKGLDRRFKKQKDSKQGQDGTNEPPSMPVT